MVGRVHSTISTLERAAYNIVTVNGNTLVTIYNKPSGSLETLFFNLVLLVDSIIYYRA